MARGAGVAKRGKAGPKAGDSHLSQASGSLFAVPSYKGHGSSIVQQANGGLHLPLGQLKLPGNLGNRNVNNVHPYHPTQPGQVDTKNLGGSPVC